MVWPEKKKYSKKLGKKVALNHRKARLKSVKPKVYERKPTKTIASYQKQIEQARKKREIELELRRRHREMVSRRMRGDRGYYKKDAGTTVGHLRRELNEADIKHELPKSRQLENLGFEPTGKTAHTNERKGIAKSNYRKGLTTRFIHLGGEEWKTYTKERPPKEIDPYERDQYGIIKGTKPKKELIQTQIDYGGPNEKSTYVGSWDQGPRPTLTEDKKVFIEKPKTKDPVWKKDEMVVLPKKKKPTEFVKGGEKLVQKRKEPKKVPIIEVTEEQKAKEEAEKKKKGLIG